MTANITFTTGKHSFCGVTQLVLTISIGGPWAVGLGLRVDRDGHQEASDEPPEATDEEIRSIFASSEAIEA